MTLPRWQKEIRDVTVIYVCMDLMVFTSLQVSLCSWSLFASASCLSLRLCWSTACVCGCVAAAACLLALFALAGKRLGGILVSNGLPLCANCLSSSGCVQSTVCTYVNVTLCWEWRVLCVNECVLFVFCHTLKICVWSCALESLWVQFSHEASSAKRQKYSCIIQDPSLWRHKGGDGV